VGGGGVGVWCVGGGGGGGGIFGLVFSISLV
jgi:hypothetical protein